MTEVEQVKMLSSVDVNSVQNTEPEADIVSSPKKRKVLDDPALSSNVPVLKMKKQHIVDSLVEVDRVIAAYEKETVSRFVSDKTDKGYNRDEWQSKTKFRWSVKGFPTDPSVPAVYLGCRLLSCQHGKDRNISIKRKWREKQDRKREQNQDSVKVYNRTQPSKKLNCPAMIQIKKMALFPAYKVKKATDFCKKMASSRFRQDKETNVKSMQVVMNYLITLPDPQDHKNHSIGEGSDFKEKPVKEIVQEIESLAARKIRKVSIISQHLDDFVRNTLFKNQELPPKSKRAYYPNSKDIHNILYRYKCRNRTSPIELQRLEDLVSKWCQNHPEDQFFYRRSIKSENGEDPCFLLCYQSKQQRRLLNLYGDLVVLDATYRTIGYSVPLYFLCVQTNVAYQIVGMFIVHQEADQGIAEALTLFKTWNPDWPAKYFMSDFGEKEETALKTIFPDSKLFMTDYHRERQWDTWGKCSVNGVRECRELMMKLLRRIADAGTTSDYLAAVAALTKSQVWKDTIKLQEWVNSTWLPSSQKWVKAFKPSEMVFHVHTSNGLEFMNELFAFAYLESYKRSTLSEMVEELVTSFMPNIYQRYEQRNLEGINGHLLNPKNIPEPVRNTPEFVVDTYISMSEKLASYSPGQVTVQRSDDGTFIVDTEGTAHTVYFGNRENLPFCYNCATWESKRQPCEHFHAVFQSQHPDWGWQQLSPKFKDYPNLVLDHDIIPRSQSIIATTDSKSENDPEATEAAYFVTCHATNDDDDCSSSVSSPDVDCQPCEMDQSTSLAQQCRQCLTEITDITFSLEDNNTLQNLLSSLQQTKCAMKQTIDQPTAPP